MSTAKTDQSARTYLSLIPNTHDSVCQADVRDRLGRVLPGSTVVRALDSGKDSSALSGRRMACKQGWRASSWETWVLPDHRGLSQG